MHPRLADLTDDIARHRAAFLAAVAAVPAEDLARRPSADTWSVAEIVDHLQMVESGTARLLAKRIAKAREAGLGPETRTDSVRGQLDQYPITDRSNKREAPEMVRPRPGIGAEAALEGLRVSREALLQALHDANGLDLTQVKATHAVLGELDVYQWVLWLGQHEARHTQQVDEVRRALAPAGRDAS
jgi:hypothetical protein